MKSPMFSIVLPTYNRRVLLQRAIESVIAQEYKDWELIIIDDGSTDDTKSYVEELDAKNIIYRYQKNKGRSAARNVGIQKSKGEYICFLDSDDELVDNYLLCFQNKIDGHQNQLLLAGTSISKNNVLHKIIPSTEYNKCIIQCLEGYFNLMPFCFHKSLIRSSRFNENLFYGEDFKFIIPLVNNNNIKIIENCTSIVHQHPNRTINRVFDDIQKGFSQLQISVIQTIDDNWDLIENNIGAGLLMEIKQNKIKDFILSAAKQNLSQAKKINNTQGTVSISNLTLIFQRLKGLIQF